MRGAALIAEVLLLHKIPHLYKKEKPLFFQSCTAPYMAGTLRGSAPGFPQTRAFRWKTKSAVGARHFGPRCPQVF
jgi:hypothetical protein